jgi:hypothetical protein
MARSGLWGSFKVRRERPRRAPNLQIPLPDNCLVEPLAANGICQQRSTGARIGPTIGRATKAPIAALAECATMSTASGEPSISPGVEKKLLDAATAVRAPVPRPRLLRDVSLMCPTYRGLDLSLRCVKAKTRGYRSIRNLTAMVYLLAGKLDLNLPS